jgi:hypothetical protein
LYRLPVVLSTVNVSTGRNQPTIAPLQDVLPGITALDRTTINAWKDAGFKQILFGRGTGHWPGRAPSPPATEFARADETRHMPPGVGRDSARHICGQTNAHQARTWQGSSCTALIPVGGLSGRQA